jgi:hypothetical protein
MATAGMLRAIKCPCPAAIQCQRMILSDTLTVEQNLPRQRLRFNHAFAGCTAIEAHVRQALLMIVSGAFLRNVRELDQSPQM